MAGCGCGKGRAWVPPTSAAAGAGRDALRAALLGKWQGSTGCVDVVVVYPAAGAPISFPVVDGDRVAALDAALDAWELAGSTGRVVDVCQTVPA